MPSKLLHLLNPIKNYVTKLIKPRRQSIQCTKIRVLKEKILSLDFHFVLKAIANLQGEVGMLTRIQISSYNR